MCLCLCIVSTSTSTRASAAPGQSGDRTLALERLWSALHDAVARCDWMSAEAHATLVLEASDRGSASWLGAVAALAQVRYTAASPWGDQELLREALELVKAVEWNPHAVPLTSSAQRSAAQIELALANGLQARGNHEAAVLHLRKATTRLRSGLAESPEFPLAETLLAQARSLLVLDKESESRPLLEELRDRFAGTTQAAIASVLLQQRPQGLDAYRGRYQGDSGHAERMGILQSLVPEARAEVANALGIDLARLEQVFVGSVDRIEAQPTLGAVTLTDPRQFDFAPVVVVFSQPMALGMSTLREWLVHELGHAALSLELGLAHERLPDWLVEGAVQAVAAPWERLADRVLADHLRADQGAFFAPDFQMERLVDFRAEPCRRTSSPMAGLGLWPLERGIRERGWRGLIPALRAQASVDAAIEQAFGQAPPPASVVEFEVAQLLERRRAAALPELETIREAHAKGPAEGLKFAENLLARSPTPLARGFALWDRADALEAVGRLEEALAAYRKLGWEGQAQLAYVQDARQGYIRTLLKLGREAQAERELAALERDATNRAISAWATHYLREVRAALGK